MRTLEFSLCVCESNYFALILWPDHLKIRLQNPKCSAQRKNRWPALDSWWMCSQ